MFLLEWLHRQIKGLGLGLGLVLKHYGMGEYSNNGRGFSGGFQIVVTLSSRELTPAETSLLSKGLSFCPASKEIDTFSLRKHLSDFVRR